MKVRAVYHVFHLVHNVCCGAWVNQEFLLHLGSNFPIKEPDWSTLCRRIEDLLCEQVSLQPSLPKPLEDMMETIVE